MLRIAIVLVEIGYRGIGKRALELWIVVRTHTYTRQHVYRRPRKHQTGKADNRQHRQACPGFAMLQHHPVFTHTHENMENSANVSLCTHRIELTCEHLNTGFLFGFLGCVCIDASRRRVHFTVAFFQWLICVCSIITSTAEHSVSLMTGT